MTDPDPLLRALRERATPDLPPVDVLLQRAFPAREHAEVLPRLARPHGAVLALALVLVVAVAALAPGSDASQAWVPGLVQRGSQVSHVLLDRFQGRTP